MIQARCVDVAVPRCRTQRDRPVHSYIVTLLETNLQVTVFDFSIIMERTEKRVERDLLGAGPKSVEELRAIRVRLKQRYRNQLERNKQKAEQQLLKQEQLRQQAEEAAALETDPNNNSTETPAAGLASIGIQESRKVADQVLSHTINVATGATSLAAGMLAKMKSPGFNPLRKAEGTDDEAAKSEQPPPSNTEQDLMAFSGSDDDGDWVQSPMNPPTDAIEHFSIDDDDDML
jgi:hypothetical protein